MWQLVWGWSWWRCGDDPGEVAEVPGDAGSVADWLDTLVIFKWLGGCKVEIGGLQHVEMTRN